MSDRRSVELLEKHENIFGTLTLHHITMTLDDLLGAGLNPHNFCKPILKSPKDRDALLSLALSAHPKVSFGSDSAPHPKLDKLKDSANAGIFSSPILLPALVELFCKHKKIENLQKFISENAIKNYQLNPPKKVVELEKKEWSVPGEIDGIIPMWSGRKISWKIAE